MNPLIERSSSRSIFWTLPSDTDVNRETTMLSGHQRPHSNKCTEQSNHQISVKVKVLHLHIYLQNKAESRMEEMEGAVQTILVFFFSIYQLHLQDCSLSHRCSHQFMHQTRQNCKAGQKSYQAEIGTSSRLDQALALGWTEELFFVHKMSYYGGKSYELLGWKENMKT